MRKIVTMLAIAALAGAACGSSTSTATLAPLVAPTQAAQSGGPVATLGDLGSNTGAGCSAGTYNGNKTTVFCGTAKATVIVGGTTYQLTGGSCVYDASVGFAVNIGTMVTGTSTVAADGPQYFGVVATPGSPALATGLVHGTPFVMTDASGTDKVTVAADHKSGSASGTSLLTDDTISVTFTC